MFHYRMILKLKDGGINLRDIAASTGNSCRKTTKIIELTERKGLVCPLDEEMADQWIVKFLFPGKSLEASARQPLDFDYIHKGKRKIGVDYFTLTLF